jgi:ribonuclease P protein subunit RPR2
MAAKNGKGIARKIAKERMTILYQKAMDTFPKDSSLSKEYIKNIKQISNHYKVTLSPEMRAGICKKCMLPLIHGDNLEIRVLAKQKRLIYRCKKCGSTNSFPISSAIKNPYNK